MSFDEIPMKMINDVMDAICDGDRGTWLALALLPVCMLGLDTLFCGFAA